MTFSGRKSSGCGHGSTGDEAGTTVDRPPLRRIKRHCRLLAALSTGHVDFDFLLNSGSLRRGDSRQSIVLGLLAGLASLGLVLQTLVVKKNLLTYGPHKLFAAIDASDRPVRKFRCLAASRL